MDAKACVTELIEKARVAQQAFENYTQEQVDKAVRAVGKAIYDNADELAKLAAEETGMGRYEDKILKNQGKTKMAWYRMKGVKSRGIIRYLDDQGLVEVAKPIGVIGSVCPTTNPTMTPAQNAMIALKGGNAMIICPHPRAKETGYKTVYYMRKALEDIGYPVDLIQIVPEVSMEMSAAVMEMCDACISTGGPGMVKAAYKSGKPAFGVGQGNVQTLVDRDANLEEVAGKVAISRTYDNGVLCACEQCVHIYKDDMAKMVDLLKAQGAAYISAPADVDALRKTMFPDGSINKDVVGINPIEIAKMAGLDVPADTKFLLVSITGSGKAEYLSQEKLCPVIAIRPYETWEEAVAAAKTNLLNEGAGHSSIVHSNTKDHVEYAGEQLPVARIGVNMIGSKGLGGGFDNGLMPTATLGCGTWGNNSISGNLWWDHLVNISRIAYVIPNSYIPTDEEIWAE